ncbi:FAD-binding molybdopterin dehydrogenase [Labrys miyagiensis]
MDQNTIETVVRPANRRAFPRFEDGDAFLAGGTWLFSEPQPRLRRLVDLSACAWDPLTVEHWGLAIASTCTVAALDAFQAPPEWTAAPLISQCCRAFLASFKIWNMATVGGNLCMALPAGPMISLCAALEGTCITWTPLGGERHTRVVDFVQGPLQPALKPGDILRRIDLPREALMRRFAFRRASLSPLGRSGVLLIGTRSTTGGFTLTVTASTRRPVQIDFKWLPVASELRDRLEVAIPDSLYYDDIHGAPDWRRHMTHVFAEEIRAELRRPAS